jgi:hypothetical protein
MNEKKISIIIYYFLIFFFILLPLVKLFNSNATFFDLGVYVNKINNIKLNKEIFIFHFEPFLYLLKKFVKFFFSDKYFGYGIILCQSIFLLLPLFFLKKKIESFVYLLNPFVWNLNIFDFHTESFGFVIIFFVIKFFLENKDSYSNIFLLCLMLIKETFLLFAILFIFFRFFVRKKIDIWSFFIVFIALFIITIFVTVNYNESNSIYLLQIKSANIYFENIINLKVFIFIFVQIYLLYLLPRNYFYTIIFFFLIPQNIIFLKIFSNEHLSIITHHYIYMIIPLIFFLVLNAQKKNLYFIIILTFSISSFPLSILSIGNINKIGSIKNYFFSSDDIQFNAYLSKHFTKMNKTKIVVENNVVNNFILSFENINVFPSVEKYTLDKNTIEAELKDFNKVTLILKKKKIRHFLHDKIYNKNIYEEYLNLYFQHKTTILFENHKFIIYQFVI